MSRAGGYTLIEMLTTVAGLVIVLGLMVSLARYVRDRSARQLTEQIMLDLGELVGEYEQVHHSAPPVPALIPSGQEIDEILLRPVDNNRALMAALQQNNSQAMYKFLGLPSSMYDGVTLRDPWGTPIVFMAKNAANIGMKAQERMFFMSAGPDRRFSTVEDNIYSYEAPAALRPRGAATTGPTPERQSSQATTHNSQESPE